MTLATASRKKLTIKQIKELPEISAKQKMWIKIKPHQAMLEIVQNRGLPEDWITVFFRIRVGYEIAKFSFLADVVAFYDQATKIMEDMYQRNLKSEEDVWSFLSDDDRQHVSVALENVDTMEEGENRQTLIYTFRKAQAFTEPFARNYPR